MQACLICDRIDPFVGHTENAKKIGVSESTIRRHRKGHGASVAPRVQAERTVQPEVKYEAGKASQITLVLDEVPEDEKEWREAIKKHTSLNIPDDRKVELTSVRYWGKPEEPMIYTRFEISDRVAPEEQVDLQEMVKIIRGHGPKKKGEAPRSRIVIISDAQAGKLASGGGTPELFARVGDKLAQLVELVKQEPCEELLIVDPGDLIENCYNVTSQAHTNDLTLPEQLRVARGLITEIVSSLSAYHTKTRVVTVPSNHGQHRVKQGQGGVAGKPSDDFGLDVHHSVAEAFHLAGREDVEFVIPEPWRESLALRVQGLVVGVVHGHQYRPGKAGEWWQGQSHGDQPVAAAQILLVGHYHNFKVEQSGAIDGKPRWIIQSDAMDGGSDWFQNISGEVSEPSIATFTVSGGTWDNLRRITAQG